MTTASAVAPATSPAPGADPPATAAAAPPGAKDVTAVLFQWDWDDVARACTEDLGPSGYGYVQVSPPQETIQGPQWWVSYQPVSYRLGNRQGDRAGFEAMVRTCHDAGVRVIADAVVNHMSAGSGTGTAGTRYGKYDYPGHYQSQDFHDCRRDITDYRDRWQVQSCELVGLSDLDTGSAYVQQEVADYLDDLRSMGVDGFRIDAAKHVAVQDLAGIKQRTSDPGAYWVQEVIHGAGEPVVPEEYTGTGDVHEFRFGTNLKRVFQQERLAYLRTFGESWGMLPSSRAVTFVDNHDTERNGSTLSTRDGATYTLANVFTLAWPYGSPAVHSGYGFSDYDAGPPRDGDVAACYADGWTCQHAWPQVSGMVGFRNAVAGTGVTDWWDDGDDRIAFGRGAAGYVALNHTGTAMARTFQTSLPAGSYCDVTDGRPRDGGCAGDVVTVDDGGRLTATVGPHDTLAVHVGARTGGGDGGGGGGGDTQGTVSFAVDATTQWGQEVHVVGDVAALGGWDPSRGVALAPTAYPRWTGSVTLPPGTRFAYKYVRRDGAGAVQWESGANRTATVPASGRLELTGTWRD
ncbi:carbohydrate-binding module family 20 domain-containing protein [Thalassiella azotivora]